MSKSKIWHPLPKAFSSSVLTLSVNDNHILSSFLSPKIISIILNLQLVLTSNLSVNPLSSPPKHSPSLTTMYQLQPSPSLSWANAIVSQLVPVFFTLSLPICSLHCSQNYHFQSRVTIFYSKPTNDSSCHSWKKLKFLQGLLGFYTILHQKFYRKWLAEPEYILNFNLWINLTMHLLEWWLLPII